LANKNEHNLFKEWLKANIVKGPWNAAHMHFETQIIVTLKSKA